MHSAYYFLHPASGRSWPTDDPHRWLIEHRDDDLLAAARTRLTASPDDPGRCLRAVLRRCDLALVRVVSDVQVVVQHWGEAVPDLRKWAKEHRLARAGVVVTFVAEKAGRVVVYEDGQDVLLSGERADDQFPWSEYIARYERRLVEELIDQDDAPAYTNFGWPGVPEGRLSWRVLRAIWRVERVGCPNCDVPLVTTNFSWHRGMLSFGPARVVRHCFRCRRRFEAAEERPLDWLASVLPPELRPTHLEQWRRFEIDWPSLGFRRDLPVQLVGHKG